MATITSIADCRGLTAFFPSLSALNADLVARKKGADALADLPSLRLLALPAQKRRCQLTQGKGEGRPAPTDGPSEWEYARLAPLAPLLLTNGAH